MQLLPKGEKKDILVLGAGKTGLSCINYLLRSAADRVASLTLYGGTESQMNDALREMQDSGVKMVLGTERVQGRYDLALVSPGIPEESKFSVFAAAHSKQICDDVELAFSESPKNWIVVTGTNGKTTTTSLLTRMMNDFGYSAVALGNIGVPALECVEKRPDNQWFCAELSSFQLARSIHLKPRAAILLNITPDHLEWHKTFEAYAAAKEKVFANMDEHDLAIVSVDDPSCADIAQRLYARGLRVMELSVLMEPASPNAAFLHNGMLMVRLEGKETCLGEFCRAHLKGIHNAQNILAASAVALELGVSVEAIYRSILAFDPIEHRIEPVGSCNGIEFVNDSKATNADSAIKALESFKAGSIVALLGGHDKKCEFETLASVVCERCRNAVCFGEAGMRIAEAIDGASVGLTKSPAVCAQHLADAFEKACELARPGDVVLLSPACSSFDEFTNMGERGRYYKMLVNNYIQNTKA